jgi:hypothetical protein
MPGPLAKLQLTHLYVGQIREDGRTKDETRKDQEKGNRPANFDYQIELAGRLLEV